MRGRRGTTSGRCCGGSTRTRWSGGRCWRSRTRSNPTRSSRRKCTCWARTRGAAHAVFQRVPVAVLLSDDGRDGGVHAAGGGGDGDAGGQRDNDDRVDPAGGDGQGAAVRDPRGGAHGGRRRRRGDRGVTTWSRSAPIRRSASASRPTITISSIAP